MKIKAFTKTMLIAILSTILIMLVFSVVKSYKSRDYMKSSGQKVTVIESDEIKIGFSLGTLKEERWLKDRDILMAKVKELGAKIIVQNANNDDKDQLKQVKYLLEQNIDVLIIVPNDLKKASEAVDLAKKQGVKVISYDRLVLESNVDMYISFDSYMVGELMAKYVAERNPNGNVLIINGPESDYNTLMIKEGYDKVLYPYVSKGSMKIVKEDQAPNWMKEYAFKVTDDVLQKGIKVNAIIAGNDGLADGIIEALSEYRLAGKVNVVGQDADISASQRIVEGTQLMTVYKPIEKLADVAARVAVMLAKGEKIIVMNTINDGKYDVPYYVLEPIAVDKENIDQTIIKDGFHRQDEVYRNK